MALFPNQVALLLFTIIVVTFRDCSHLLNQFYVTIWLTTHPSNPVHLPVFSPHSGPCSLANISSRDDGTADHNGKPNGGGVTTGSHKLGPKANQGAINARLRALDRTKHPCRKWERKPIQLKSFTGVVWELPSWRAPKSRLPNEEDRHNKDVSQLSESKAHDSSTAMESEKSNAGENGAVPLKDSTPTASSPVPAPLLPAVVAAG